MFQIDVPMFPLISVTMGQTQRNGNSFSKSKLAAAAIFKSILPIEPPSREMNSLLVIFNKNLTFWGILTFKGSIISGALML